MILRLRSRELTEMTSPNPDLPCSRNRFLNTTGCLVFLLSTPGFLFLAGSLSCLILFWLRFGLRGAIVFCSVFIPAVLCFLSPCLLSPGCPFSFLTLPTCSLLLGGSVLCLRHPFPPSPALPPCPPDLRSGCSPTPQTKPARLTTSPLSFFSSLSSPDFSFFSFFLFDLSCDSDTASRD